MSEKAIWGVHMDRSLNLTPIENNFIAIGWEKIGDLSKISPTRDAFKAAVAAAYNAKPGAIPVNAGILLRFVHEMKKGDVVVYPSKPDRMVNLGIVESDYVFHKENIQSYPNRRKVKWLHQVPRTDFSADALHEIGAFITLFKISNYADEFLAALDGKRPASADNDAKIAEIVSSQVEDSVKDFIIKRLKENIEWDQFEQFIGHLLECMGYHARVTQKSKDGGIDIIAHKDELGFEPPIIKVQCKQILGTIGQPEIAQLYGHVESKEFGLFVTLGAYSADARRFERSKGNLRLIDGDELIELIFNHYPKFEPKYQVLLPLKRTYSPGIITQNSGDFLE
jgi:restriction system protein